MKLSKEDLKQKIKDSITDNDELVITLLEDIEDSMEITEVAENPELETMKAELEDIKAKYEDISKKHEDITKKYIERFFNRNEEDKPEDNTEELEEVEEIDVKEI